MLALRKVTGFIPCHCARAVLALADQGWCLHVPQQPDHPTAGTSPRGPAVLPAVKGRGDMLPIWSVELPIPWSTGAVLPEILSEDVQGHGK